VPISQRTIKQLTSLYADIYKLKQKNRKWCNIEIIDMVINSKTMIAYVQSVASGVSIYPATAASGRKKDCPAKGRPAN